MDFFESIKSKAMSDRKTIVLPESSDIRILKAAHWAVSEGLAHIALLGSADEIRQMAEENGISLEGVRIINHLADSNLKEYAEKFHDMRKSKGLTYEQAEEMMKNPLYFGAMMVKTGHADGLVTGAKTTSADVLRAALQVLKSGKGSGLVSTALVMDVPDKRFGHEGLFIYADAVTVENPNEEELAEIAVQSAKTFRSIIGAEPKVAMLSYSTFGSGKGGTVEKVVNATRIARQKAPELLIDGEMQFDAAISPEVAAIKAPGSKVAGSANVLIFPDLNAANIGYKNTELIGGAKLRGSIIQGLSKPMNDLSRGCTVETVVGTICITCIQAQSAAGTDTEF